MTAEPLTKEQTEKFVWLWNEANGYPQGLCDKPNMRYVKPNEVTWNEYDAPQISLSEFKEFLNKLDK